MLIAKGEVLAYNFKTGKHIVTAGELVGYYTAYVSEELGSDDGEAPVPAAQEASGKIDREGVRAGALLSASAQENFAEYRSAVESRLDARRDLASPARGTMSAGR